MFRSDRAHTTLLALSVGIVLADSSVVTIALPEILARYHVALKTLAWVLTSFNLALALTALPAALIARRRPALVFAVGTALFVGASLTCGFASTFGVLIAGRTVQGVAGAAIVCAALALLFETAGSNTAGARVWILALTIFFIGKTNRDAGLSAALLSVVLVTVYLTALMTSGPLAPGSRR